MSVHEFESKLSDAFEKGAGLESLSRETAARGA